MAQFSWISLVSLNHEFTSSMNYNFFFSIYYLLEWIKEICPLKHLKKNTGNPQKLTPTNLYDSTEFIIHQYFIKLIEFVLGLCFSWHYTFYHSLSPKPCWRRPRPVVTGVSWRRTIFCGGRSVRRRESQRPWCMAPTVSVAAQDVGVLGRPCIWGSIRLNRTGGQPNSGVQRYNSGYFQHSAWQTEICMEI